jgi:Luciferase
MTRQQTPSQRITEEVTSWPGVEAGPGRRGEFAFRIGRREIGHLHGDHAAHFSFPKQLWEELRDQGRIVPHPVFPNSRGPAARQITDDADVSDVIDLLRLNYDHAVARHGLATDPGGQDDGDS